MQKNQNLFIEKLENGLTIIVDQIDGVESVSYELSIPGGLIHEGEDQAGSVLLLAELTSRGAGDLNARQISDAFEGLGARHSESASSDSFSFRGLCLAPEFAECLGLTALQVLHPTLPEEEIAPIKSLLLQDIQSLPDSPSRLAMKELYAGYLPSPYNRSGLGTIEGISSATRSSLQELHAKFFSPQGAVLSVAGKVKVEEVVALAKKLFSKWTGAELKDPHFTEATCPGYKHIHSDSAQLQIALAFPSARYGDAEYYSAKVASVILSGGMFGRVFVEVREKRGLVYSVYARHLADRHSAYFVAYAGTTPERAQETLDVLSETLASVSKDLSPDELSRAKTHMKSSLVLGEESTSSRAVSNANDYWMLGRIRPFEEIMEQINLVDQSRIAELCNKFPAAKFYLTTLGSRELKVN
jgi:predicted Zn-dependent peptidase